MARIETRQDVIKANKSAFRQKLTTGDNLTTVKKFNPLNRNKTLKGYIFGSPAYSLAVLLNIRFPHYSVVSDKLKHEIGHDKEWIYRHRPVLLMLYYFEGLQHRDFKYLAMIPTSYYTINTLHKLLYIKILRKNFKNGYQLTKIGIKYVEIILQILHEEMERKHAKILQHTKNI